MKGETDNYRNVVLLCSILGIKLTPYPVSGYDNYKDLYILSFMVRVRGWTVILPGNRHPKAPLWASISFVVDGITISGKQAYHQLFDPKEDAEHLTDKDVTIRQLDATHWHILHSATGNEWSVLTKLVMDEAEMYTVATLLHDSHIPSGKTIQLQADAHIAGSYTWIGTIASYDDRTIPFAAVSADIGCGISVLPVVRDGEHVIASSVPDMDALKTAFMLRARQALFRGVKSESGDRSNVITLFNEALAFFGSQIALDEFTAELNHVFTTLKITPDSSTSDDALAFASKFLQSLGSAGNHFIELTESTADGSLYTVTHSGSRGLGALVYKRISALARIHTGGNIATGPLAVLYRRAFDVLCGFAQINRILCGMAVLKALKYEFAGAPLRTAMVRSSMFTGSSLNDIQRSKLLFGLTHNGIKTFVYHEAREVIHILFKGAVALSSRSDVGIVALRAGEGCVLFVLDDPSAKWVEVSNRADYSGYTQVFELEHTDLCFAGHGAGRNGSATATRKRSSYLEMIAYYNKVGFIGNLSPNVIGDNPEIAYKPPAEIMAKLPLDVAVFHTTLKTLVNHKEGLSYRTNREFAKFCVDTYAQLDGPTRLWLDLGLVRGETGVAELYKEQQAAITEFLICYECDRGTAVPPMKGNGKEPKFPTRK